VLAGATPATVQLPDRSRTDNRLAVDADEPNFAPHDAVKPDQPLNEMNTSLSVMAFRSAAMDFSREDRAPERLLNEAIWKSVKGANSRMPAPKHAPR
jgi:hypothetical protein